MGDPVVYFEIAGRNGKKMQEFYSSVFGWSIDSQKLPGYGFIKTGVPGGVDGGI